MIKFLQIEPTTRCNLNCSFCSGRSMVPHNISTTRFDAILDLFPDLSHVELQGEGEPLLHPEFFTLVDSIQSRNLKLSFISNGTLFNKNNIDHILDRSSSISKILISIESPKPETFKKIRGFNLNKASNGISALIQERNRRKLQSPVIGFAVSVLRSTYKQLPLILDLYKSLGLDGGIIYQPLQRMAVYTSVYDMTTDNELFTRTESQALVVSQKLNRRMAMIEKKVAISGFYDSLFKGWKPLSRTCPWLEKGLFISSMGIATPCCMIKESPIANFELTGSNAIDAVIQQRKKMAFSLRKKEIPHSCNNCLVAEFATMPLKGWALLFIEIFKLKNLG